MPNVNNVEYIMPILAYFIWFLNTIWGAVSGPHPNVIYMGPFVSVDFAGLKYDLRWPHSIWSVDLVATGTVCWHVGSMCLL